MAVILQYSKLLRLLAWVCLVSAPITIDASTEYNRYLAHIFRKYGNGGTMSFEGLEHLMYSLGLGQIEFDPTHTIEEHRPKDEIPSIDIVDDTDVKNFIAQQHTFKLLDSNEDGDIQLKNTKDAGQGTDHAGNGNVRSDEPRPQEMGVILEFKEMHDPKHRHPREKANNFDAPPLPPSAATALPLAIAKGNACLSPKALMHLVVDHDDLHKRQSYRTFISSYGGDLLKSDNAVHDFEEEYNEFINNAKLTPLAFMKLCPALLAQIDQHVCMKPAPLTNGEDPKNLMWNAWLYATCSIFILSACGLLGILLVPLMKSAAYQDILKFLVAVAVGTLSGDALMHLLPHALVPEHGAGTCGAAEEHDHGHDNTPVWICACAFATAVFMYMLENLLPLLKGKAGLSTDGHGHSHGGKGHIHTMPEESGTVAPPKVTVGGPAAREINTMLDETKDDLKEPKSAPLTPLAFMVIIGDGLHNLTDGLAIGAAFATDPVTGMATAFAVLCHELPHELGDFALLLQTGLSLRRAVYMNIVSSVLSFVGMAIGLLIAGMHSTMTQWIYAGTAGSFLYIALADLIPAMSAEGGGVGRSGAVRDVFVQIAGILIGGIIMLLIAINEDALTVLFE